MKIAHEKIEGWQFNYLPDKQISLPTVNIDEALNLITGWLKYFPKENSWVQNNINIPSLIVRLDCTIQDGKLLLYEIEERPAGLGFMTILDKNFTKRLSSLSWPQLTVVVSEKRRASDDHLWCRKLIGSSVQVDGLVLIRANADEADFYHFLPQSVSTIKAKGNKLYGEKMGLWRAVTPKDNLPWQENFVLKPKQGAHSDDVLIWDTERRAGHSTKSQIEKTLAKHGSMYMQKFIEPMPSEMMDYPWLILRPFFGYDFAKKLGDTWEAFGRLVKT